VGGGWAGGSRAAWAAAGAAEAAEASVAAEWATDVDLEIDLIDCAREVFLVK